MGIFSVAITGLNAAQAGLLTTNHNIVNASTEGYHRQRIIQSTNTPMFAGVGYFGQGTHVLTVRRIYDQQLNEQVLSAGTGAAETDSYLARIAQIDNLLADPEVGLTPALSDFFRAVQEVAAHPPSVPARQGMLSASEALVARFHAIDGRMDEIRSGVNKGVTSEVAAINAYATQIADINQRIIVAQAIGQNQPANDLLDQRDQLIADLNTKIRATTITQSDGTYSVFIGNGQPLVVGTKSYSLAATPATDDAGRIIVTIQTPSGGAVTIPESLLTGGSLGGLIAFRSQSLDEAQNALGRIALTLAQNFNAQHRLGQDLDGNLGGDYFDMSTMGPSVSASSANTGTGVVAASIDTANIDELTTSDYRLRFAGGTYSLLRLSDNEVVHSGALPVGVDGMTIHLSGGMPADGDTFLIRPTRNGAGNLATAITNPRAIAAAAPIRTGAALSNTGTGSISAGVALDTSHPDLWDTTTLNFVAGGYQINGAGPVIAYTPGANIDLNGWRVVVSGTPAVGDIFTIERNSSGISDNRNAVLLGALQTKSTMEGGTATYQSAYSSIVSKIGNKTREVEIANQAQQNMLEQAKATRAQLSGVNLDEEAANLLRYQQAYQAAAKAIGVARTLFDEILALGR